MDGKRVKDSVFITSIVTLPEDANAAGNVHAGVIMKNIDNTAGVVAVRHGGCPCVTASIDRIDFHNPVYIGNLITLKASLNMVGSSSMEVGVRVEAEDIYKCEVHHIASAHLTFVALGADGRPMKVPPLITESDAEIRREREARTRKKTRISLKEREEACQKDIESCEL